MSLKALIEAVVHLESFRNIELFYQGLYFLKCRLYSEDSSSLDDAEQAARPQPSKDALKDDKINENPSRMNAQPYCSFVSQVQMMKQAKVLQKGGVGGGASNG